MSSISFFSDSYRLWIQSNFWLMIVWVVSFIVLGYFGTQPPSPAGQYISMLGTVIYFGFFALMPWWITWKLDMRKNEKIGLCITMSMGVM